MLLTLNRIEILNLSKVVILFLLALLVAFPCPSRSLRLGHYMYCAIWNKVCTDHWYVSHVLYTMYVITTDIENDREPTTSTKVITVYMTCSFTDGTTKLDSDKIRHVLEEVNCSLLL